MFKKILIGLLGLVVALLILAIATMQVMESKAETRLARTWTVDAPDVPIPWPLTGGDKAELIRAKVKAAPEGTYRTEGGVHIPDPLEGEDLDAIALERAVARGEQYLATRAPCAECHGADFGGKVIMDNPAMGRWVGPNVTTGGLTANYTGADWVRIIRHGVKPDGSTATMPSIDFQSFSDQEISDIAAAIHAQPAVSKEVPPTDFGPVFTMLVGMEKIPLSAEVIDHSKKRATVPPPVTVSLELGEHLGHTCSGCHGATFVGGPMTGGDPSWPPASDISGAALKGWTLDEFRAAMTKGTGKDGRTLAVPMADVIPYTAKMQPEELESLFQFLKTQGPTGAEEPKTEPQ